MSFIERIIFMKKMKRFQEIKKSYTLTKDQWVKYGLISEEAAEAAIRMELNSLAIKMFGSDSISEAV